MNLRLLSLMVLVVIMLAGCRQETRSGGDAGEVEIISHGASAQVTAERSVTRFRGGSTPIRADRDARRVRPEDRKTTEPTVLVKGTVKFDDGQAITSATVELWREGSDGAGESSRDYRLDVSPVGVRGDYAVAGKDGSGLRVEVKGLSRAIADLQSNSSGSTVPAVRTIVQDFIIPAPATVTGRVTDENDSPVTAALVSLRSEDAITDGWYYGNQQVQVGADGSFTMEGVATGNASIGAVADGYAPAVTDISVPTTGPVHLRLLRGSAGIDGHVLLYPGSAPLGGATVSISPAGTARTLGLASTLRMETVTAGDGTFQFQNLPAGQHSITLKDASGNPLHRAPGEPDNAFAPTLRDNETTSIALMVFPGYTIAGTVYDHGTSEPLAGAVVRVHGADGPQKQGTSGADGSYEITGVSTASRTYIYLECVLDGFGIAERGVNFPEGKRSLQVNLPENTDRVVQDISMMPMVKLSGRVENTEQEPVVGASVTWMGGMMSRSPVMKTDSEGHFSVKVLTLQSGLLEVEAKGYGTVKTDPYAIGIEDVDDILIVLDSEAVVEGRVEDPDGEPVSGAVITAEETYVLGPSMFTSNIIKGKSEVSGKFRIEGLGEGSIELTAVARGFSPGKASATLKAGATTEDVVIKLGEELSIEGRVLVSDDVPAVDAYVQVWAATMPMSTPTRTDDAGYFKVSGLPDGEVTVSALTTNPRRSKSITVQAGDKDVVVRLDDQEKVRCRVVDRMSGDPIVDFSAEGRGVVTDGLGPGEFQFTLERGYMASILIKAKGYSPKEFNITAGPEDDAGKIHILEMGIGGGVQGRVVSGATGDPMPNIPVVAGNFMQTTLQQHGGSSITDSEGKFLISGLPSGSVMIKAVPSAPLMPTEVSVEIEDGGLADAGDIVVNEAGAIYGEVNGGGEHITMVLNGPIGGSYHGRMEPLAASRLYRFDNLKPGTYRVSASSITRSVEVLAGEELEVNFDIGGVTMQGTVTSSGETTGSLFIEARNQQTGQVSRGGLRDGRIFRVTGLSPGMHDVTIRVGEKVLHTEQVNVPDLESFVKDFVLP